MPEITLLSQCGKLTREELALVPTPLGTATHRPIPHAEVVNALVDTLGLRKIGVAAEEYAVSKDGMNMFGVMEIDQGSVSTISQVSDGERMPPPVKTQRASKGSSRIGLKT